MKNAFIKSTLILMIGTMFTKILGFIIKIIFTRIIGQEGINLYAIIVPTYSLLIAITQLGLPYAISSIMARGKYRGIKIFTSIIPISLLFDAFIITIIIFFAPYLSNTLLNSKDAYYPIISICFILPFTTISGIIKGYYFGKQNMLPNAISNIFEQLTRLIILSIVIPLLLKYSVIMAVSGYIIASAISELVQIIIYLFFAPKNFVIKFEDIKPSTSIMHDVFKISIPNVSGRIIGNICYFLEPIILTNILLYMGYSNNYIITEYSVYNSYVIPLLTMPSFFTMTLNTTIIPEVAKHHTNHHYVKKRLLQSLTISFLIGLFFCIFIHFNSSFLLKSIYNTNKGINYLKILTPIFPLFYLEGPLVSVLQGLNKSKFTMNVTLIGCIIKLVSMSLISVFKVGIYGLIISEILNILIVIILNIKELHKIKYL